MLTYGADIEVFLQDMEGEIVSAVGKIGGSKEEPLWVNNGNLQEDNALAEFAILPTMGLSEFKDNIFSVLEQLREHVSPLILVIEPSAMLSDKELASKQAQMFGCDPDYSAYTFNFNTPPDPKKVGNLRTAGAHLHLGYPEIDEDPFSPFFLARFMDLYLGLPSVILDTDKRRRSVYGKAGALRIKEYGMEYRTLSNFWIKSEGLVDWAFNQLEQAYLHFKAEPDLVMEGLDATVLEHIINSADEEKAKKWIQEYNITLP